MKKVRNWLNAEPAPGEINLLPSLTIPDDSMSVQEILHRHVRGLPLSGQKVPIYDQFSDLPDPRRLDLAEQQELRQKFTQELFELRSNEAKRQAELKAERQQEIDDRDAFREWRRNNPPQPKPVDPV